MTDIAVRNRAIKKTLEQAFGRGQVKVRGSRGTGYGFVYVKIEFTPLDMEQRSELESKCKQLLRAAKVDLGRAYTDDTCQYETDKCHISFNTCRYYRTMRMSSGDLAAIRELGGEWETIERAA
jgi:hypothetical protein